MAPLLRALLGACSLMLGGSVLRAAAADEWDSCGDVSTVTCAVNAPCRAA